MSRSITVGADGADQTQAPDTSTINAKSSSEARQVQMTSGKPVAEPRVPHGSQIATTMGHATLHKDIAGRDLVTVGKLQMTKAEAEHAGILNVAQVQPAPEPRPTAKTVQADGDDADGGDDTDDADHVSIEEYASSIDTVADALTGAGLDPTAVIGDVIASQAGSDSDGITLSQDASDALRSALGDEGARDALNKIEGHVEQEMATIIASSGLTFADAAELNAFARYVDAGGPQLIVALLQGNSAPLRAHINRFKQ